MPVEVEVSAAVSVVTDAQIVLSDEVSLLATAADAALLITTDVSVDDDDAKILRQTNKQTSPHSTSAVYHLFLYSRH